MSKIVLADADSPQPTKALKIESPKKTHNTMGSRSSPLSLANFSSLGNSPLGDEKTAEFQIFLESSQVPGDNRMPIIARRDLTVAALKIMIANTLRDMIDDSNDDIMIDSTPNVYFGGKRLENTSGTGIRKNSVQLFQYGIIADSVLHVTFPTVVVDVMYYREDIQVGDKVEILESDPKAEWSGAWFEAAVTYVDIGKFEVACKYIDYNETITLYDMSQIKPRTNRKIQRFRDISVGDFMFVNYNIACPNELGFWYKAVVETLLPQINSISVSIIDSSGLKTKHQCKFAISKMQELLYHFDAYHSGNGISDTICKEHERGWYEETHSCDDCSAKKVAGNPPISCEECGCMKCFKKESIGEDVMCSECLRWMCLECTGLDEMPEGEFYCPKCKNNDVIIEPGSVPVTSYTSNGLERQNTLDIALIKKFERLHAMGSLRSREWTAYLRNFGPEVTQGMNTTTDAARVVVDSLQCIICANIMGKLEKFNGHQIVENFATTLPCNHSFCAYCLVVASENTASCPICRETAAILQEVKRNYGRLRTTKKVAPLIEKVWTWAVRNNKFQPDPNLNSLIKQLCED